MQLQNSYLQISFSKMLQAYCQIELELACTDNCCGDIYNQGNYYEEYV